MVFFQERQKISLDVFLFYGLLEGILKLPSKFIKFLSYLKYRNLVFIERIELQKIKCVCNSN
jgi:hypothetical protein